VAGQDTRELVTVARVGEIPSGGARQVTVAERWVGLFNIAGDDVQVRLTD
jgi:hypothetical protein